MISRRTFLLTAPVVAGAMLQFDGVTYGQQSFKSQPPLAEGDALSLLTWNSFVPFINTEFAFGTGYNAVSLRLVEMTDSQPKTRRRKGRENFVLKFQGPYDRVLDQGTYEVSHFGLGDFNIFITNGGRRDREQFYVAVINRTVS